MDAERPPGADAHGAAGGTAGPRALARAAPWVALVVGSGAAIACTWHFASTLLDDEDTVGAEGRVVAVADLQPPEQGDLLLCRVTWLKSDVTWDETVHDGFALALRGGPRLVVARGVATDALESAPPTGEARPAEKERAIALATGSDGSEVACFGPGDDVAVSGCLDLSDRSALVPCPGDDAIVLAAGGSVQTFVDVRLADATGWLAIGLFGVSIAGSSAMHLLSRSTGAAPRAEPMAGSRAVLLLGAVVAGVVAALLKDEPSSAYLLTGSALAVLVSTADEAWRRRRGAERASPGDATRRRVGLALVSTLALVAAALGGAAAALAAAR